MTPLPASGFSSPTTRFSINARRMLFVVSLTGSFLAGEVAVRVLDPLPYFAPREINKTEYGNLSRYDSLLGWSGIANGQADFVTQNSRVRLRNNSAGFRDIEHVGPGVRPEVLFLGDSYTWGYEVEFDDMFVSHVRREFPEWEFFNLAHRGYGTDQSLLTFRGWRTTGDLRFVVLMFSDNDVDDNASNGRYYKPKPRFILEDGRLVLTGVPVQFSPGWQPSAAGTGDPQESGSWLFHSQLVHHLHVSLWQRALEHLEARFSRSVASVDSMTREAVAPASAEAIGTTGSTGSSDPATPSNARAVTRALLQALRDEVAARGATLLVAFIPAPSSLEWRRPRAAYADALMGDCRDLGIPALDLLPGLRRGWLRPTYRLSGRHWNPRGHRRAAELLREFLVQQEHRKATSKPAD